MISFKLRVGKAKTGLTSGGFTVIIPNTNKGDDFPALWAKALPCRKVCEKEVSWKKVCEKVSIDGGHFSNTNISALSVVF